MLRRVLLLLIACLPLGALSSIVIPALHHWYQGDAAYSLSLLSEERSLNERSKLNHAIARVVLLEREVGASPHEGVYGHPLAADSTHHWLTDSLLVLCTDLQEVAEVLPEDLRDEAMLYHARARLMRGDTLLALDLLESAMRMDPHPQTLSNPLMLCCLIAGDWTRLERVVQLQRRARPDNPMVWYCLAELSLRQGAMEQAFEHLQTSIDIYPMERALTRGIELATDSRRRTLAVDWLHLLRYRYRHNYSDEKLEEFCNTLLLPDLFAELGPDPHEEDWQRGYPQFFPDGREWVYKARYGFIPLGQLVVGVRGRETVSTRSGATEAYRVYYKIDSNPIYRLLIDLHDVYESLVPAHCMANLEFTIQSEIAGSLSERAYHFDAEQGRLRVRGYSREGVLMADEYPIAREVVDGLTLLFAARRQVVERHYGPVLTIVDEEPHRTVIEDDGRDWQKIMGKRRAVRRIHGRADYDGLAGLTGEFWGAMSDDNEGLPLYARFQIGLGKITMELSEVRDLQAGAPAGGQ